MGIGEGNYVVLSRPWSRDDGVTIPAGTGIWVTADKERELRDAGFIDKPADQPGEESASPGWGPPLSAPPRQDDPDFFDVHNTGPTYPPP